MKRPISDVMEPTRVMITSGGGPGVWGLLHALRRGDGRFQVIVQDCDADDTPGTVLGDERVHLPPACDPSYVERLLEHCGAARVDVLIPVFDGELAAIAAARGDFNAAGTRVLLPPIDVVRTCVDKWATHERLEATPFLPRHRRVETLEETRDAIGGLGYPAQLLCIRPTNLAGGRGVHVLDAAVDAFAERLLSKPGVQRCTAEEFLELRARGPERFRLIVSEFLPGDELGIDLLAAEGRVCELVTRRKCGAMHSGNPMRMDFIEAPAARAWIARLCRELRLDGLVNVDARYDAAGVLRLIEINPRPSACIGMSAARVNLLEWAIDRLLGEECDDTAAYSQENPPQRIVRALADIAVRGSEGEVLLPLMQRERELSGPARLTD
ncbi:carbamoyl phosphate synthase-like protein [Phycisphaerae bacterium RAS1]|nr:carbamoyl phosphate synthase-like protein [Phycisphaerae bacterium RAS1]